MADKIIFKLKEKKMFKKLFLIVFIFVVGVGSTLFAKNISSIQNNCKLILTLPTNSKLQFIDNSLLKEKFNINNNKDLNFYIGKKNDPFLMNISVKNLTQKLNFVKMSMQGYQNSLLENPSRILTLKSDDIEGYYVFGINKIWSRAHKLKNNMTIKNGYSKKYKLYAKFNYNNKYSVSCKIAANDPEKIKDYIRILSKIKIIDTREHSTRCHSNVLKSFIKNLELLKIKHKPGNYSPVELKESLLSKSNLIFLTAVDQAIFNKNYDILELQWLKTTDINKRLIILSYIATYVAQDKAPNFAKDCKFYNKEQVFFRNREIAFVNENLEMIELVLKETHKKNSRRTLKAILDTVQYIDNSGKIKNELRLFQLDAPKYSGIKIATSEIPLFKVIYESYYKKNRSLYVEVECKLVDNSMEINDNPTADANFVAESIRVIDYKSIEKHKFPSMLAQTISEEDKK